MTTRETLAAQWGISLQAARVRRGLSSGDLAARSGLSLSQIYRAEHGQTLLSDEARMRVAAALGCRVEDIFSYPAPTRTTP